MVDTYVSKTGNVWRLGKSPAERPVLLSREPLLEQRGERTVRPQPLYEVTTKSCLVGIAVGLVIYVLFALFIQLVEGGICG